MSAAPILHTVPSTPGPQRPPFAAGTPKSVRTAGAYPRTPFPQDVPPSDDEAESGEDTDDEAVPRAVKRNAKSDAASSYFPSLQHATPPPTHLSSDAPPPVRTAPNTPGYDALLLTDGSTVAQKESEAGTTMPVGFTPPNHYTPVSELVPVIAQFPLPITSTLSDSTTSTSSYPSSAPTSPESFDSGAKAGIIASSVSAAIGLASPTTAVPDCHEFASTRSPRPAAPCVLLTLHLRLLNLGKRLPSWGGSQVCAVHSTRPPCRVLKTRQVWNTSRACFVASGRSWLGELALPV
ncbi:hypothetical protein C8J57DRAFT_1268416, partial [Mycena rebaudengoi]